MSAHEQAEDACRLGVLAFGDSITNGGGELQWGVALQSWALWVARGLGLAYTGMAQDAAMVSGVLHHQVPMLKRSWGERPRRYELGCLYIGVNDVRTLEWDAGRFGRDYGQVLDFLAGCCDRVLAVTAPLDLGRPRAGAKVGELNRTIRRLASEHGALMLDLSDFEARNLVMTDHVHPTALGQVAIAGRALHVLVADGMEVVLHPSSLVSYETTWWRRLRGDVTYAYRHLKVSARAAALVVWFRVRGART